MKFELLIGVDMNKKANWAFGLSVVAVILCIVSVCIAAYRTPELGFDYQGVIVGVLSLLVTVLVGLNIYTLVDFRRKENILEEKIVLISNALSNINKAELSNGAVTEGAIASLYYSLMGLKDPLGLEYRYIYHNIVSLEKVSHLDNVGTCNAIVKAMLETIAHPESISISKKNKDDLYVWISKVKDPMRIDRFGELIERIARLKSF